MLHDWLDSLTSGKMTSWPLTRLSLDLWIDDTMVSDWSQSSQFFHHPYESQFYPAIWGFVIEELCLPAESHGYWRGITRAQTSCCIHILPLKKLPLPLSHNDEAENILFPRQVTCIKNHTEVILGEEKVVTGIRKPWNLNPVCFELHLVPSRSSGARWSLFCNMPFPFSHQRQSSNKKNTPWSHTPVHTVLFSKCYSL